METIGSFEAKTHLAALLERAANGETIIITKHGKPMARLAPISEVQPHAAVEEAISGLLELRKYHYFTRDEIKGLINEGRKY